MKIEYNYIRKSTHKIETIKEKMYKPIIDKYNKKETVNNIMINGENIKTNNERLRAFFLKGCECEMCGIRATHFALEKHKGGERYFLNLYTRKSNQDILMLKEHKKPLKIGGKDIPDNWIILCDECYLTKFKDRKIQAVDNTNISGEILVNDNKQGIEKKVLETELLELWQKQNVNKVYKYKGIIYFWREPLVNIQIFNTFSSGLFEDIIDTASFDEDVLLEEYLKDVSELLEFRKN